MEHAQIGMGIEPRDWVPVQYVQEISIRDTLFSFISSGPILTLLIFWWVIRMFRKSGAFGLPGSGQGGSGGRGGFGGMSSLFDVQKANYKVINKGEKVKTKFTDVAGLDNAKEEVNEFVHFLRDPSAYTKLGARIPKGLFLLNFIHSILFHKFRWKNIFCFYFWIFKGYQGFTSLDTFSYMKYKF